MNKQVLLTAKDNRGELVPLYSKDFSFNWERCFVIKNSPKGAVRGKHAHKKESQIITVLSGSIKLESDCGFTVESDILRENEYCILPPLTWNTFEILEEDTMILVLGSEMCDEKEYIRDYDEFMVHVHRSVV